MKKQYINGRWCDALGGGLWHVQNPATEEWFADVPFGDERDSLEAIAAAESAFASWKKLSGWERGAFLRRCADLIRSHAERFAPETTMEAGKPLKEALGEWMVAADLFEWYGEEAKRAYGRVIPSKRAEKRMQVVWEPMGVVGIITAWNFPAYNLARACAAALAAGCTVVCKGSEYTPLSSMNLFQALHETGLPAGVANLVNGDAARIGESFLNHPAVRKISFTGSTRVGKLLMDGASRTVKRLALELGGNAPVLIFEDVPLEQIARTAVTGRFRNAGQVCNVPQRFYVAQRIYDDFLHLSSEHARQLRVGYGLEEGVAMGPLINKRQQEHVLTLLEHSKQQGATVLTGGQTLDKGFFVTPAVVADRQAAPVFRQQEIFGPVLPVTPFSDLEEVLQQANDTPYGLAAYVWTNNLKMAYAAAEGLQFGMIGINDWAPHGTEAPFGGWKQSGLGHESGSEGMLEYMEKKLITINLST
ncbi:MAG: NAD-dependent succinate-semialdehyde dehydrogenase [Chitinophagales bacterium]|nr:NAD-dependent succinate-semialdehyde dehydrogenase [Chitinophagales bacterium]MDW8394212.1 NAD-dependent succinate-semialdehyde dehydrogenase [Chitinophagales bacterium]